MKHWLHFLPSSFRPQDLPQFSVFGFFLSSFFFLFHFFIFIFIFFHFNYHSSLLLFHFLSQTEREFKLQLVADVKPARACSKDTLFYWVHPEVKEVGCGTRQSKNLPKPYCVIIILLGCQQDVTGEVEECCSVAAHAESWDNEDTLPSLGMGHHTFGVAQERGGWARLARERGGQPGRVEGGTRRRRQPAVLLVLSSCSCAGGVLGGGPAAAAACAVGLSSLPAGRVGEREREQEERKRPACGDGHQGAL